jgi:hypothetical protein
MSPPALLVRAGVLIFVINFKIGCVCPIRILELEAASNHRSSYLTQKRGGPPEQASPSSEDRLLIIVNACSDYGVTTSVYKHQSAHPDSCSGCGRHLLVRAIYQGNGN